MIILAEILRDIDGLLGLNTSGDIIIHEEEEAVKELIKNMLFVNFHEVIMSPRTGSIIPSMLHEDITDDNAFVIREAVLDTLGVGLDEYGVEALNIVVLPDKFNDIFLIEVSYIYNSKRVDFSQPLNGA